MPPSLSLRWLGLVLGALLAWVTLAGAQARVSVEPVNPGFAPGARTLSVTVRNGASTPLTLDTAVMAWTQVGGADALAPTGDLLVVPPRLTLAPGSQGVVRVARVLGAPASTRAYRLLLSEVPAAPAAGTSSLQAALRLSLPVFEGERGAPQLAWHYDAPSGALRAQNSGGAHAKVVQLEVTLPGGVTALPFGYVLPGGSESWRLTEAPSKLRYQLEGGDWTEVVLAP